MCDYSANLIAWLDRELPEPEAADIQRHLKACESCRGRLHAYARVSKAIDAYCEATVPSQAHSKLPRWTAVSSIAAAAATAAAALLLVFPRARVEQPPAHASSAPAPAAVIAEASPAPPSPVHRRHSVAPTQKQVADWLPAAPAIQIAIPAEAIFPPARYPTASISLPMSA